MDLLKKGILTLLVIVFITSCEENDFIPTENYTGTGLTEITFSSLSSSVEADENGLKDGTYITVKPLAIGVSSYEVDFGAGTSPITISGASGTTVSYDYSNDFETANYTITVTAKSDKGLSDVVLTDNITVNHSINSVSSSPDSPIILNGNVFSIFSDGTQNDGTLNGYTNTISGSNLEAGTAEYNEVEVGDLKNKVIQYSRLQGTNKASITFSTPIIIADVFGTNASADYLHVDLHSIYEVGVDKVKITLGGKTFEQTLTNNVWTGLDLDFASEGITQIDAITFELGVGATASNEATLNVDNIYLYRAPLSVPEFTFDEVASDYDVTFENASELATSYSWDFGDGSGSSTDENPTYSYANDGLEKMYMVTLTTTNSLNKPTSISKEVTVGGPAGPLNPEILKGDFEVNESATSNAWKIANSPSGKSDPFGRSSDGSCTDYDGVATGSKTRGAKWSSSQGASDINGTPVAGNTRYAYQAVTLSPNTDYVFEYEYAIRTGGADTNSVVGLILNGHFDDGDVALASNPLIRYVGTVANGKFGDNSCSGGTLVKETFRSNAVGEVSIFFYTFNDKDAYIDNVKMYPAD
ncbi:PKD domain-containing protein [uncultured Polaribacter sp.]|uniref:PKD domain-containing protein n=1 Tax=uncultured Polaribacter sp. TaxID=174711 RepID=UPI00370469D4